MPHEAPQYICIALLLHYVLCFSWIHNTLLLHISVLYVIIDWPLWADELSYNVVCLQCSGSSMEPTLRSGDVVLTDHASVLLERLQK